jgi:hypothetical protein
MTVVVHSENHGKTFQQRGQSGHHFFAGNSFRNELALALDLRHVLNDEVRDFLTMARLWAFLAQHGKLRDDLAEGDEVAPRRQGVGQARSPAVVIAFLRLEVHFDCVVIEAVKFEFRLGAVRRELQFKLRHIHLASRRLTRLRCPPGIFFEL